MDRKVQIAAVNLVTLCIVQCGIGLGPYPGSGSEIDTVAPAVPTSADDAIRSSSLTASPTITWNAVSDTDLSHYELAIGTSQGATDILDYTNVGNVSSISKSGLTLESGKMYYASIKAVDESGNKSEASQGDGWQNLKCPTSSDDEGEYIKIHGNTTAGLGGAHYDNGTQTLLDWTGANAGNSYTPTKTTRTISDFCVAKYEMKLYHDDEGGDGVVDDPEADIPGTYDWESDYGGASESKYRAVSVPQAKPWVEIKTGLSGTTGAVQACANLGTGYMLINNAQWQTIARDIEATTSNWYDGGTSADPNDDYINRGNSEGDDGMLGDADSTDTDPCIGTDNPNCQTKSHVDFTQKRTHDLTNAESGKALWDLAGNAYEWVNDLNHRADGHGAAGASDAGYQSTRTYAGSAAEFKLQWGPAQDHSGKSASEYGGFGYFFDDTTPGGDNDPANPGAVLRGGIWGFGSSAGVFVASLLNVPSNSNSFVGFRCVAAP